MHRLAVDPKSSARAAKGAVRGVGVGPGAAQSGDGERVELIGRRAVVWFIAFRFGEQRRCDRSRRGRSTSAQKRACAPGCEKRGVCNTDLGRCDCPPYIGGDACDTPLIAACAAPAAVGLTELAAAPCVYDQLSANAPVSCECLMGCEAIGLMGVRECYVMDESNRTVMQWVQSQIHLRGLAANKEFFSGASQAEPSRERQTVQRARRVCAAHAECGRAAREYPEALLLLCGLGRDVVRATDVGTSFACVHEWLQRPRKLLAQLVQMRSWVLWHRLLAR